MERVIAGRFQTKHSADAVAALIARYIDTDEIRILHDIPPELLAVDGRPRSRKLRPGRVMLSVRITNPVSEERVIAALRAAGATDIEPDHGEWCDGEWSNFNPVGVPRLAQRLSM